jgi:hypothetical protein
MYVETLRMNCSGYVGVTYSLSDRDFFPVEKRYSLGRTVNEVMHALQDTLSATIVSQ